MRVVYEMLLKSFNANSDLKKYIGKFVEENISFANEYDLYGETIKFFKFFKLI